MMLSQGAAKYKRSTLERVTNYFVLYCVAVLVLMVVGCGIASIIWLKYHNAHMNRMPFVILETSGAVQDGLINMASYILTYQTLIPLSLYISVEMIKLGQIYLMSRDLDMYDEASDKNLLCRALNTPEEVGQIKYILSDKTGTLTENKMVFKCCSVGGVNYGNQRHTPTHNRTQSTASFGIGRLPPPLTLPPLPTGIAANDDDVEVNYDLYRRLHPMPSPNMMQEESNSSDGSLLDSVDERPPADETCFYFFLTMAVCNTVIVNRKQRVDDVEWGYVENNVYNVGNSCFYDQQGPSAGAVVADDFPSTPATANSFPAATPHSGSSLIRQFTFSSNDILRRISSLGRFFKKITPYELKRQRSEKKCIYDGESPDELCLVKAADAYGFSLSGRSLIDVSVTITGPSDEVGARVMTVKVLKVLPFDSRRKRMSVILHYDGQHILLCKGADDQVLENLSPEFVESEEGAEILEKSNAQLRRYANKGLRTLCLAMRVIPREEYEEWMETREFVESSCTDENDEILTESSSKLERNLRLLGVTAIEDSLQDGVTETIESLRAAGIQIWVLTGDKLETAMNIARSCHLFKQDAEILVLGKARDVEREETAEVIFNGNFNAVMSSELVKMLKEGDEKVIEVAERSTSILCYRMTPAEKADVVKSVKKTLKGKVLAIGDGANDVPMILDADVGVGISGREGLQAVMASDFAFSRFRFLRKFLLVHGHWNYYRLASVLLYFLYKNAIFVFILLWFQFFNGFSCWTPVDPYYSMLYPIIFTSVQPMVYGIVDQDVSADILLEYPVLYRKGRDGKLYTLWNFLWNMLDALWQSLAVYFVFHFTYIDTEIEMWAFSFALCTGMFFANCAHLALIVRSWTRQVIALNLFFVCVHFGFFIVYNASFMAFTTPSPPVHAAVDAMQDKQFWSGLYLSTLLSVLPRFLVMVVMNHVRPGLGYSTQLQKGIPEQETPC
ncbi:Protein TAT-4 b [Aphelenchoides avenae]|nr:Protein TAT-4 b [Aphelenchus avenae]